MYLQTSGHKIPKQDYGGGNSIEPIKGFYKDEPITHKSYQQTEIVRFRGFSISRRKWRKYIPDLRIDDHGYDVGGWLGFLDNLREMMLDVHRILLRNPKGKEKEKGMRSY